MGSRERNMHMRSLVLVAFLACAGAFSLTAVPQSIRVVVAASNAEVVMFGGGTKSAPKKAAPKKVVKKVGKKVVKKVAPKKAAPKKVVKAAPKVVKKVVKKPVVAKKKPVVARKAVRKAVGEPNIVQKLFAMPFIGGAKGVTLGREYEL